MEVGETDRKDHRPNSIIAKLQLTCKKRRGGKRLDSLKLQFNGV